MRRLPRRQLRPPPFLLFSPCSRQHTSAYVSIRAACGLPVVLAMFLCYKFTSNLELNLLLLYFSSKLVLSCCARYARYVREVQVQEALDALKREGVHTPQ